MSRKQPIAYTTETGVENPEPPKLEQAIPTRVRIKDAEYGLKTAAKVTRDRVAREQMRVKRLGEVSNQLASINTALISGKTSDRAKAVELRDKLQAERVRLIADAPTHWSTPKVSN